jgi:hypothetical protein
MKLTEAKLKSLISEVLEEQSLKSELPQLDIKDLIPKAKEMKATRGEEDLMNEGGGLLIAAVVLATPKILQWMGKGAKTILSNKKVQNALVKTFGEDHAFGIAPLVEFLTTTTGNFLHGIYLNIIRYSLVKPLTVLIKLAGGTVTKEDEMKMAEGLFIVLLASVAVAGVSIGVAQIATGHAAGHGVSLTVEALTSAVKIFEGTEYAGMVPAALAFLKTDHH